MKVYLAECLSHTYLDEEAFSLKPYVLQSFYSVNAKTVERMKLCGDIMIDSGAFSLQYQDAKEHDIYEEYLEKYAEFINQNNIDKFFELDLDIIVGYEKVLEYRKKLERLTNKQPIVVWHPQRGKDEFLKHCEEYSYVALGGYVGAPHKQQAAYLKAYPWFISTAHKHKSKIHGLGFTSMEGLKRCHFDSVDSTSWTSAARFGTIHYFDGEMIRCAKKPKNTKVKKQATKHNFIEWIKFQNYAEGHL